MECAAMEQGKLCISRIMYLYINAKVHSNHVGDGDSAILLTGRMFPDKYLPTQIPSLDPQGSMSAGEPVYFKNLWVQFKFLTCLNLN